MASQLEELLSQAIDLRRQWGFGDDAQGQQLKARYDEAAAVPPADFACFYTSRPSLVQLAADGFRDVHDGVVRITKSDVEFTPESGKTIRVLGMPLGDVLLRVAEILPSSAANPEWVLGCKAI